MKKAAFAVASLTAALVVSQAVAAPLPLGPGRNVVIDRCSSCHATSLIEAQRHDLDGWNEVIDKMTDRGLIITDADRDAVVGYLAKVLSPQAAASTAKSIAAAKPATKPSPKVAPKPVAKPKP